MPEYGPKLPTIAAQIDRGGDYSSWTDINNIKATDNNRASSLVSVHRTSDYLVAKGFAFDIPEDHSVLSISIGIKCSGVEILVGMSMIPQKVCDETVSLLIDGAISTVNLARASETWAINASSETVRSFITTESLTPSQINSADFGVVLAGSSVSALDPGSTCKVDSITVTVETAAPKTLLKPALDGSESIVGFTKETEWGTTPTAGTDPDKTISNAVFLMCKEESFNSAGLVEPLTDEMNTQRKVGRISTYGGKVKGSLRFVAGPESLGYFLTALLGPPTTTTLAESSGTDEGAYQHVWYNGLNARGAYPVPHSIESQYAGTRSKLIQGAICENISMQIANNGAFVAIPQFFGKRIVWLHPDSDDTNGSGTTDRKGVERPAVMTASPVVIEEPYFHFAQISAYPEIASQQYPTVLALFLQPGFTVVDGQFTAGSGNEIGAYRVDNFLLSGRITLLFTDEDLYDDFVDGDYFSLEFALEGETIQGAYKNKFAFTANRCKGEPQSTNQVAPLTLDIGFTACVDPVTDIDCQFTIINTVSSY